jgi:hypothetical protein
MEWMSTKKYILPQIALIQNNFIIAEHTATRNLVPIGVAIGVDTD